MSPVVNACKRKREDDDDDQLLVQALENYEASHLPLFMFRSRQAEGRRNWQNIVGRQRRTLQVVQNHVPRPNEDIGQALMEALHNHIRDHLATVPGLRPRDHIHFALSHDRIDLAYQSTHSQVLDFLEGDDRLDTYLNDLVRQTQLQ